MKKTCELGWTTGRHAGWKQAGRSVMPPGTSEWRETRLGGGGETGKFMKKRGKGVGGGYIKPYMI